MAERSCRGARAVKVFAGCGRTTLFSAGCVLAAFLQSMRHGCLQLRSCGCPEPHPHHHAREHCHVHAADLLHQQYPHSGQSRRDPGLFAGRLAASGSGRRIHARPSF